MKFRKLKNRHIVISAIIFFTIMIIMIFIFFNDTYYMAHINSIDFPEEVTVVKTQVSTSHVYGIHVLAEEIIETRLSWDEIRTIINDSPYGKDIHLFYIPFKDDGKTENLEWDDYSIELVQSIDGKAKEGMNYYLINEHTPYATFPCVWETSLSLLSPSPHQLISKFLINQNHMVLNTRRTIPQHRQISAYTFRTLAVVALVTS